MGNNHFERFHPRTPEEIFEEKLRLSQRELDREKDDTSSERACAEDPVKLTRRYHEMYSGWASVVS